MVNRDGSVFSYWTMKVLKNIKFITQLEWRQRANRYLNITKKKEKLTKWIDKNIYLNFKISMLYFSYVRHK